MVGTSADWAPSAHLDRLRERAALIQGIRAHFAATNVLEVETPTLASFGVTDPHIHSLTARYRGRDRYLQSSPEFAMKRLLAAGSGAIYQICRAYRNDPFGPIHNPEFTILEWYRPGFDLRGLMQDIESLLRLIAPTVPVATSSYADVFVAAVGLDPHTTSDDALREAAVRLAQLDTSTAATLRRTDALDLLFSLRVQPVLRGGHLIHGYPICQSALACLTPDGTTAERFELFIDGLELGNGYLELDDAAEQRRRMNADNQVRGEYGYTAVAPDERLLAALAVGIGKVAGVAVGIERLLMALLKQDSLADVAAFGHELRE